MSTTYFHFISCKGWSAKSVAELVRVITVEEAAAAAAAFGIKLDPNAELQRFINPTECS